MIFVDYDGTRPHDEGQFHIRIVEPNRSTPRDPRYSAQLGYWCDREHLMHALRAIEEAFKRDDAIRTLRREAEQREKLASEIEALAGSRAPHLTDEENFVWSCAYSSIADRIRHPERYSGCVADAAIVDEAVGNRAAGDG